MTKKIVIMAFLFGVTLTFMGCGHSAGRYQPIVDGTKNAKYYEDLNSCQELAEERSYLNDDVKSSVLLGAGIGAVAGALEEDLGGAIVGAVVGSVIGGGARSWGTRTEKKNIIIECMRLRGHHVVEIP